VHHRTTWAYGHAVTTRKAFAWIVDLWKATIGCRDDVKATLASALLALCTLGFVYPYLSHVFLLFDYSETADPLHF
jgi:hypothetical protein